MVLGIARPWLRSDGTRLFALRGDSGRDARLGWPAERGAVLYATPVDLVGGFPGYADRGAIIVNVQLRVTERYLLVDERRPHGFGIPISDLDGTALVEQTGRDDFALRVFYRSEGQGRLFTLRFRGRSAGRGPRRSVGAQQALHRAGLDDRLAADPPPSPNFTLPWSQTREFEQENVIWTGRASAPLWIGAETAPSEIWLTTKSLIWGSGHGEGINRVPLPLLMDLISTRLRDRLGTPAVYLAIGDESTGRYEIPFIFDQQEPPDRAFRERGAFLVGLRSRGIADGAAAPYNQPWRASLLEPSLELVSANDPTEDAINTAGPEPHDEAEQLSGAEGELPFPELPMLFAEPTRQDRSRIRWMEQATKTRFELPRQPLDKLVDDATPVDVGGEPFDFAASSEVTGVSFERHELEVQAFGFEGRSRSLERIEPDDEPTDRFTVFDARPSRLVSGPPEPDDRLLAEWSGAAGSLEEDLAIRASPSLRPVKHDPHPADTLAALETDAIGEVWTAIRTYEEAAVGALSEALRAIDAKVAGLRPDPPAEQVPSSNDQARALAELDEMARLGAISVDDARHRRERLLALGEVSVRLRTLLELHAGGYLSHDELDRKRTALVERLSTALVRTPPENGSGSVA